MERKEPYATQEEFNQRVIRYRDIPAIEARPGSRSHIISTERITISFAHITIPMIKTNSSNQKAVPSCT